MSESALQTYARGILSHIPWEHWAVMGGVSLALTVILLIRKRCSVYGAIALGLTVFMGLFLLDAVFSHIQGLWRNLIITTFAVVELSLYSSLDIESLLWKGVGEVVD